MIFQDKMFLSVVELRALPKMIFLSKSVSHPDIVVMVNLTYPLLKLLPLKS
ncbi:MAG: hypothetical protein ACYCTB_11855 [bacterium]